MERPANVSLPWPGEYESRVIRIVENRAMRHPIHMFLVGFSPAAVANRGVNIAVTYICIPG